MNTNETLYNTYLIAHKNNRNAPALYSQKGEMITHRKLLEEIDKAAAGLLLYKTVDTLKIGIININSYEEAVFLLAASKIGAVSKFIDFSKNVTEIGESIAESSVDVLVIEDRFMPMEPYINPSALPVIILGNMSPSRSNCQPYSDFIRQSALCACQPVQYKEKNCAVIIWSSGTTGKPKPIELSDKALNVAVMKHIHSDLPMGDSNIMLKLIPSFIGMGVVSTLYTCLVSGNPIIYLPGYQMIPQVSLECMLKFMISFRSFLQENQMRPDTKLLLFAAPMFYRGLCQCLEKIEDLSFIGCMLAGGSAMSKEELELIDAAFAKKGCSVPVIVGYGQNEMAAGVTMNEIHANKRGSAGKPMAFTKVKVVDLVTGVPVPNNTVGKILEQSESLFIGYENMPERTMSSFVTDENGEVWFDTNDVGYIDEDNFLFITGRASRVIIRFDVKCSLDKIESKLRGSKFVKEAGVIALPSIPYDRPIAFVTLKDEYLNLNITSEAIIEDVQNSRNPLNDPEMVDKLLIVESLPYLSSGKLSYLELEKEAEMVL